MDNEFGREGEPLSKKPDAKRFKDSSKRLRAGKETRLSNRASVDWRTDRYRVCDVNGADADIIPIDDLTGILRKSRTAEALMAAPAAAGLVICYDRQLPGSQLYVRTEKPYITLNPLRPKGDLLNMLVRELRRLWQHQHGALVNPLMFDPDEAILVNRAQHADVFIASVKVAWELKLCGESEAWDYLAGSPMADVSRTFEIKAQADFRTINNGLAARAAYDKVFDDCRTKALDKRIIHQMLLDETGYVKKPAKRPRVSMDLFRALGEVPHGRNYLSMSHDRAPTDHCYATVEDRSNANFLWFIKFERSFQEKEMQMLQESVKATAEIVDFAKWSRNRAVTIPPGGLQ